MVFVKDEHSAIVENDTLGGRQRNAIAESD
jgi:hypothetical protein